MRLHHALLGTFLILPITTLADTDTNLSPQDISVAIIGGEPTTLNQLPFLLVLYYTRLGLVNSLTFAVVLS